MLGREERIASIKRDLPSIVDCIIAHNHVFQDLNRADLNEILKLFLNKMPLGILNSISQKDLETQIEKVMADEQFLSPGFFVDMPYRKKTTINVKINSITRGLPSFPDFED